MKKILMIVLAMCFVTGFALNAYADDIQKIKIDKIKPDKIKSDDVKQVQTGSVKNISAFKVQAEQKSTQNLENNGNISASRNEVASMNYQVGTTSSKKSAYGASTTGNTYAVKIRSVATSVKQGSTSVSGTGTLKAPKLSVEKANTVGYSANSVNTPQRLNLIGQ